MSNKWDINVQRLRACDAGEWDEAKHPRAKNGQFGSGGGSAKVKESGSAASPLKSLAESAKPAGNKTFSSEALSSEANKSLAHWIQNPMILTLSLVLMKLMEVGMMRYLIS